MNPISKAVDWLQTKAFEASFNTVSASDWYLRNSYYRIAGLLGAGGGYSPRPISTTSAMQSGAVFACVKTIAEDSASLPLFVYQRTTNGRARADTHPLAELLQVMPNPETSAAEFREALTAHVLLTGNGYAKIVRSAGRIIALWQLLPDQVEPARDSRNTLYYRIRDAQNGQWTDTPATDVFHLRGFGWDGISGYSILQHAKQTIGLALSAEEYAARFAATVRCAMGEGRRLSVTEICRIFRVPPEMVLHSGRTSSGPACRNDDVAGNRSPTTMCR
jgi:phage portal protein BeeE